ncbi:MAG: hypothetical protein F6K40_25565 [Okeania sp. SIO3I5]|uniref:hypothetical protein n=1 Tax=Okeania sp. SIO3I5 TaxID=2607805 RepID=UPI0013B5D525|nr:hypothetical protein [Okeania sp. SIO3I5]NEQ39440.1 hypothetical protein [Okeania sp. SIO3I5]
MFTRNRVSRFPCVSPGEITQKKDIAALAKFLTCCLQGLRVISKINPDRKALSRYS